MHQLALAYGHKPNGPWAMIIHADGRSEFFSFEREEDMWCCQRQNEIAEMLREEMQAQLAAGIAPARLPTDFVADRALIESPE